MRQRFCPAAVAIEHQQFFAVAALDPEVDQASVIVLAEPNRVLAKGGDVRIRLKANPLPQTLVVEGADGPLERRAEGRQESRPPWAGRTDRHRESSRRIRQGSTRYVRFQARKLRIDRLSSVYCKLTDLLRLL